MKTFFLTISFVILATSYTANKALLTTLPIHFLSSFKLVVSALFFLGVICYKKTFFQLTQKLKQDFWLITFICIIATAIPYYLKMYTLKHLNSSVAMLIGSLDPFITAFYSYFIFHERLEKHKILGILLGFFSVFLLLSSRFPVALEVSKETYIWSIITGIAAIFIGRYGWICTKKLLDVDRYSYAEINLLILMGSGIVFVSASLFFQGVFSVAYFDYHALNKKTILLLLYTTIASNIFFYYVYSYFIKNYPITQVSYTGLIIPLSSHFLGWFFLEEGLSISFILSFSMMALSYLTYYFAGFTSRIKAPKENQLTPYE